MPSLRPDPDARARSGHDELGLGSGLSKRSTERKPGARYVPFPWSA